MSWTYTPSFVHIWWGGRGKWWNFECAVEMLHTLWWWNKWVIGLAPSLNKIKLAEMTLLSFLKPETRIALAALIEGNWAASLVSEISLRAGSFLARNSSKWDKLIKFISSAWFSFQTSLYHKPFNKQIWSMKQKDLRGQIKHQKYT